MKDRPGKTPAGVVRMLERFLDKFGAHVICDSKANEHPGIAVNLKRPGFGSASFTALC